MIVEELRRYRDRWQEVDALTSEEERSASLELRWRQLNSLYVLAVGLGLTLHDQVEEAEDLVIYQRWAMLREWGRYERS
jgi:hypothetical protein